MGDRAGANWTEKWGTAVPLSVEGAGSPTPHLAHCRLGRGLGLRTSSVPSGILIHPSVRPQYTNVTLQAGQSSRGTGRTVTHAYFYTRFLFMKNTHVF